jgi:transposase InsO family protein
MLRPGARVEIWGQTYRLLHRTATGIHKLENVDTGDIETVSWIEYVELWNAGKLRVLDQPPPGLPANKLMLSRLPNSHFTDKQKEFIARNKHYCLAVKNAILSETIENASSPNIDILRETLAKPVGHEGDPLLSRGQIQKIYHAWVKSGERDSVLAHGNCGAERKSTLHEGVIDAMRDVIEASLVESKLSLENLFDRIKREVNLRIDDGEIVSETEFNIEDDESIRIPSLPTIAKYKDEIEKYVVVRVEDGEYEAQLKSAPKGKVVIPQFPGARWELDHTLLPIPVCVECVGPNGEVVRLRVGKVWLTAVIDVATRFVVAMVFGIDPPSSERTLAALKMAMTSKAEIFERHGIENRIDVTIVPTMIVFDNGKDLHAKDVLAATGDLNIIHEFAGVFHGDHKPFIERFFRTAKSLLRKAYGATDKGQRKRGPTRKDIPEPEAIPIEELERIAWKWLMDTYHVRKHAGLWNDKPANVMVRLLERLMAERKKGTPLPFRNMLAYRSAVECDATFSFRLKRPVDSRGIRYKYLWWNSGELARMISETKCTEIDVRLDPANLGSVLVYHSTSGECFRVPTLYPFYAEGLSLWVHKRVLARIHQREREKAGGKLGRNFSIDMDKYLKNEGELLVELLDLAGLKRPSIALARHAARYLGGKLDFSLGVARLDAIDMRLGKKPPGYGPLIDMKKAADGTYYGESKPNPKSKNGRFDYREVESIADPEAPDEIEVSSPAGAVSAGQAPKDMTVNPIAGFDPNAGVT